MFSKTILSLIASAMLFTGSVAAAEPVRIIFETDMGNDVDDVLALDMLYKYQDAGKIRLLLISNNKGNAYSAPFIHLMNDFYGWSGIPVASSPAELLPQQKEKQPSYVEVVAASGIFPVSSAETFDSVEKYRQILAAQPDRSVVTNSGDGKDSWHPDLDHGGDIGPHWDYNDGHGHKWRVFPDNRIDFVK